MTVAELIRELENFDKDTDVEVFYKTDCRGTVILSTPLDRYCIMGNRGQAVLMLEEASLNSRKEDLEEDLKEIYELAESIIDTCDDLDYNTGDAIDAVCSLAKDILFICED